MTHQYRSRRDRVWRRRNAIGRCGLLAVACIATLLIGSAAAGANAKRGLATGFSDPGFRFGDEDRRVALLNGARAAGADYVRMDVTWSTIASRQPAVPRNPVDPAYNFDRLDAMVRDARARGLRPVLMVQRAPRWAEGENRPPVSDAVLAGTWKPRPGAANDFGHALATRYSGSFRDPANPGRTLPQVRHFLIWNEPNLSGSLTPQWEGGRQTGALVYRQLLNAFYRGIKSVNRGNVVISGGTGPYGDDPGGLRTRPLLFWRTVMCLRPNLSRAGCPGPRERAHLDVLAHHPINVSGGPFRGAAHRDDASTPDMWKLRRALRAAERHGTIRPGGRRPLWATEFWYHPDVFGSNLRRQARWMAESLYLFWRGGATAAFNFHVRDASGVIKSGVYRNNGTRKPAFRAFRFPFVAFKRGRRVELWGKAPRRGRVAIFRGRPGNWRRATRVRSGANRVFRTRVRMRGKPRLQARMPKTRGGARSLIYKVR